MTSMADDDHSDDGTPPAELPALELRDGPAPQVASESELLAYAGALALGEGPVAIDAERASGYRYSQRAYLVQMRRAGAGTALIDPIGVPDLSALNEALGSAEWILHAASQDLPCLAEVGLKPVRLFDTELAARLLGRDRVSLAALVASELGYSLAKGHGATDWSVRPLSADQLQYAALDVEPLIELRIALLEDLQAAGRWEIAQQEFDHLLGFVPRGRGPEDWRRLSGMHKLRKPRQWAIAREMWRARDQIAQRRDVAPGRLIPDSAIIAAIQAEPTSQAQLLSTPGFHGRGAGRHAKTWWSAYERGAATATADLPDRAPRGDGPPPPRSWAERNPEAASRLQLARAGITERAEADGMAPELLLAPDTLRRVCWEPPEDRSDDAIASVLRGLGARPWQVAATLPALRSALASEVTSE